MSGFLEVFSSNTLSFDKYLTRSTQVSHSRYSFPFWTEVNSRLKIYSFDFWLKLLQDEETMKKARNCVEDSKSNIELNSSQLARNYVDYVRRELLLSFTLMLVTLRDLNSISHQLTSK